MERGTSWGCIDSLILCYVDLLLVFQSEFSSDNTVFCCQAFLIFISDWSMALKSGKLECWSTWQAASWILQMMSYISTYHGDFYIPARGGEKIGECKGERGERYRVIRDMILMYVPPHHAAITQVRNLNFPSNSMTEFHLTKFYAKFDFDQSESEIWG